MLVWCLWGTPVPWSAPADGSVPPPGRTASGHDTPRLTANAESCRTAPPMPSTENKTTLAGAEENDTGKDRRSLNACLLGSCSLTAPGPEDGGGSPVGSPLREGRATVQLPHIQSPRGRPNGRGTSRRRHGEGGVDWSPAHVTPNEGPRPSAPEAAHSPPAACRAPGAGPQETESWTG